MDAEPARTALPRNASLARLFREYGEMLSRLSLRRRHAEPTQTPGHVLGTLSGGFAFLKLNPPARTPRLG